MLWISYSRGGRPAGVLISDSPLITARMRAGVTGIDRGLVFTAALPMDAEREGLVPLHALDRMLSINEAAALLALFEEAAGISATSHKQKKRPGRSPGAKSRGVKQNSRRTTGRRS